MATVTRLRPGSDAAIPPASRSRWWRGEAVPLLLVLLLTVAGGVLRRYHLGQQGLWFDEADLVIRAREPFGNLLRNFARPGENGPLYTAAFAVWLKIAGVSEAAVRLPSALAGTLAIPALYGLGREVRGWRVGVVAAALLALSPYAHWYAQDAKMYSLAVLLAICATWLLLVALRRGGGAWWAYVATMAAGLLIHATLGFVLAAHLVLVAWCWRRGEGVRPQGRQARWLVAVLGAVCVPLIVWGVAFAIGDVPTWHVRVNPLEIVRVVLIEFGATHRADAPTQAIAVALMGALAVFGAVSASRTAPAAHRSVTRERGIATTLCMTLVPVGLFVLLSLRQAIFADRYLIVALPGYLLLVAFGLDGLLRWRWGWVAAIAAGAGLLYCFWTPLATVNLSTQSQKEDWREAYRHIAERQRPGDVILLAPGYLVSTAEYYALRFPSLHDLPVIAAPSLAPQRDISDRTLAAFFADHAYGAERIWVLTSPERIARDDPDERLDAFFNGANGDGGAGTEWERWKLNGVLLQCEVLNGPYGNGAYHAPPQAIIEARFGETGIGLFGASWQTRDGSNRVMRGAFAPLLLRWSSPPKPPPANYTVLVRLVDASGREASRYDIPPLDGHWRTSTWRVKDDPYDPHDLAIPPDLAPGTYRVLVGLAPVDDPSHPLPIANRDGSPAQAVGGLLPVLTVTVV